MQGFIILCFASLSFAAPEGYNYFGQSSKQNHAADSFDGHTNQERYQQQPLVSKHFFIHSAPEEVESEVEHRNVVLGEHRKNYNVVFIKSPAGAAQKTKLHIVPAVNEEKTVVYVLARNAGENEVITHVEEPHATTAKPEVFFIKYKTDEEAEHAQRNIQAEYDRLGGSSSISNEGTVPVSSVIGSLGDLAVDSGVGYGAANGAGVLVGAGYNTVNTAYLPPAVKY